MSVPSLAADRRKYILANVVPSMDLRPFINGAYRDSSSVEDHDVIDPMTNQRIVTMPMASAADADQAVKSAFQAFESGVWSQAHPRQRAAVLNKLADLIDANMENLVLLESIDVGKPISNVRGWDISNAAEVYRYYAGWADKILGSYLPPVGRYSMHTRPEPVGVCAAIVPWNFPFPCISWKIAPALAAGCTVVIKPSERAPLSAQYLGRLINEAGFPPGVVNIVTGYGDVAGSALVSNHDVSKITFTGSVPTAQKIVTTSVSHLPRLTLELGGKSPNVIMADANLEDAVTGTIDAVFGVAGQNCCAGSRTFVHADVYDEFIRLLSESSLQRRLGDPLDDATQQGPQIDARHLGVISGYVEQAISQGARTIIGADKSTAGDLFYLPTLLDSVSDDMPVSREEIFGPVGCVYKVSSLDEAISRANDTSYGLAAAIWTSDGATAEKFTQRIRAGACWVNCFNMFDTVAPWGGVKQSGYGRELGQAALHEFTSLKTVFVRY